MSARGRSSSVAQQIFLLQTLVVVLLVVGAVALALVDARRTQLDSARTRSVDVAEAVADAPTVSRALRSPDPSARLQPFAERVRRDTGTDFVVVMSLDRTRFTHPDPARIGQPFIGDLGGAPHGHVFTQQYTGTLGPSVRAVVPVFGGHRVVGLVSVGITLAKIDQALQERLVSVAGAAVLVLAVGAVGAWLISRRLRRQTHGLGEREITRMYEYYDSVLHAVREGLLLLDEHGRVQMANDEAARLLDLPQPATGLRVDALGLPQDLAGVLRSGEAGPDEIHLVGDRVLLVNQAPARWRGRRVGSVVTLRDHTELRAVSGELDTVRGLAETLRSQNHEAANRLHTVVSLIEMDRHEDAVHFATQELRAAQLLADQVVGSVGDPVVSALLLGKSAQASERGVELRIDADSEVDQLPVAPRDMVTIVGNLVDNAFDAVADSPVRRVEVRLVADRDRLRLDVSDSGPGLPAGTAEAVFRRGWSTKRGDSAIGRGLGLALVGQVVRKYGGAVDVDRAELGGAAFHVRIGAEERMPS